LAVPRERPRLNNIFRLSERKQRRTPFHVPASEPPSLPPSPRDIHRGAPPMKPDSPLRESVASPVARRVISGGTAPGIRVLKNKIQLFTASAGTARSRQGRPAERLAACVRNPRRSGHCTRIARKERLRRTADGSAEGRLAYPSPLGVVCAAASAGTAHDRQGPREIEARKTLPRLALPWEVLSQVLQ